MNLHAIAATAITLSLLGNAQADSLYEASGFSLPDLPVICCCAAAAE